MFNQVKEFHEVFNHPVNQEPTREELQLRFNLIKEEWKETADELATLDLQVQKLATDRAKTLTKMRLTKELSDMMYVILGTAVSLGLPIEDVFNEVHKSNMSKLGEDGKPIRREDGKILKSKNYKEADIEQFFN